MLITYWLVLFWPSLRKREILLHCNWYHLSHQALRCDGLLNTGVKRSFAVWAVTRLNGPGGVNGAISAAVRQNLSRNPWKWNVVSVHVSPRSRLMQYRLRGERKNPPVDTLTVRYHPFVVLSVSMEGFSVVIYFFWKDHVPSCCFIYFYFKYRFPAFPRMAFDTLLLLLCRRETVPCGFQLGESQDDDRRSYCVYYQKLKNTF